MTNSLQESSQHGYPNPACPLWTALITPLHEDGSIDFISLQAISKEQADAGNALLLLGSTGEGLALSTEESFSLVEYVCNLNLPVPLMVAVGGYNLAEQITWIKRCNTLSIHSYLLSTPLYAKPGEVGQTHWFTSLLNASEHPCMLYNVPSRSGVEIPIETIKKVQSHINCWALKEASGNINTFFAYSQQCLKIQIFSGEDAMMPYLVHSGAKGLVSVCSNVWPEATKTYVEQCLSGNTSSMFPIWNNAVDELFCVANPIAVKILMHQKHMIKTPRLRAPLTHLELEESQQLNDVDQQIEQWLEEINNRLKITENNRLNSKSRNVA
jgi:4-hydroxy-tetrahydrodipicolinate synthase